MSEKFESQNQIKEENIITIPLNNELSFLLKSTVLKPDNNERRRLDIIRVKKTVAITTDSYRIHRIRLNLLDGNYTIKKDKRIIQLQKIDYEDDVFERYLNWCKNSFIEPELNQVLTININANSLDNISHWITAYTIIIRSLHESRAFNPYFFNDLLPGIWKVKISKNV